MHRTEGEGHVGTRFDPGDPFIPRPATLLTYDWCNAVQEELCGVVEGLGGTVNTAATDGTPNQVLGRLNAKFGRLDYASNSWFGNQSIGGSLSVTASTTLSGPLVANGTATFNTSIVGTANAVDPSAMAMPTKFAFSHPAIPNTPGADYPMVSLLKTTAGNLVALNTRLRTTATVSNWTHTRVGLSFDVDGSVNSGGQLWFTPTKVEVTGPNTATATAPQTALALTNGYLSLDGVANPNKDVPVKNAVTPRNIAKVSASIATNGTGGVQTDDGFNLGGVTLSSGRVVLTFAQPFADGFYQVAIGAEDFPSVVQVKYRNKQAGSVEFTAYNGAGTLISMATQPVRFDVTITGRQ